MNGELMLQVVFFRTKTGNEPVREWLKSLNKKEKKANPHIGSNFDDFLEEEGICADVESVAVKRVITYQIVQLMEKQGLSKSEMARRMNTSRSSLNRLLDPENESITLQTMERAAQALGKRLRIELAA